MNEISDRLREARTQAGYASATDAARAFGWNENTYRSHENGERGIKFSIAHRYAAALRVSLAWLIAGQGTSEAVFTSGTEGVIYNGGRVKIFDTDEVDYSVALPITPPDGSICLTAPNGMYPRYSKGDLIIVFRNDLYEETEIPLEGLLYVKEPSGEISNYFGIYHTGRDERRLEIFGFPPLRDFQFEDFLPVQVVVRAGMYRMIKIPKK